jgi:hypothetical protein
MQPETCFGSASFEPVPEYRRQLNIVNVNPNIIAGFGFSKYEVQVSYGENFLLVKKCTNFSNQLHILAPEHGK